MQAKDRELAEAQQKLRQKRSGVYNVSLCE